MIKIRHLAWLLILVSGILACKSSDLPSKADLKEAVKEQKQPLSHFNIYRGNSHSHTIFTWTHGEHRDKGINDLSKPTEFHPEWPVPPGVDWRDHNSINPNPEFYTKRQGLPENHFELAIANGYDFYAISDHSQEPNLQPVSADNKTWKAILAAVDKYGNRKDFVPIAGFEYSRNTSKEGGDGHINVLNSSEYVNADHGQRGPAPEWPAANWSIPKFFNWVKSAKPRNNTGLVIVGFNHPGQDQYDTFAHFDPEIAKLISTFEIHTNYKQNRWKAYITALNKGWRLSPIGVHDNHGYYQITNPDLPPPTFVLAPELTLEAITKAMRERRTFASWNEGVALKYSVNGYIMGSILENANRYDFNIEIITPSSKPEEQVKMIRIYRDKPESPEGVEIAAEKSFDGNQDKVVWTPSIEDSKAKYFLLQVFHENDQKDGGFKANGSTISAPVWTGR